jgi:hypothetical protein
MSDDPVLLSGGNPKIPKGDGDAPVQAYIAALPGWKRAACARLDAIITAAVPDVRKAVKWNTPFYGREEKVWLLAVHAYARYLKVAFFKGAAFDPLPPIGSKQADVRYLHVSEDEPLDEAQFTDWVHQAARIPGQRL